MLAYTRDNLLRAETHARDSAMDRVWLQLRQLCLDDFGEFLLSLPNPEFPELSRKLPSMASAEVQRSWTGSDGYMLLRQTLNFVRSVQLNYLRLAGQPLDGAKVMDFGCGYGRIARLMYYFTDPSNLYCVDPWDESIRLCRESRLPGNFFVSDYLPSSLPFPEKQFDLIYCFSVFTHLSHRAAHAALDTLRQHIAPGGVLVITVRPEEYWPNGRIDPSCKRTVDELLAEHRRDGFVFVPHRRAPIDGDITYGDTSFTFDWLAREFPNWTIAGHDRSLDDPFQVLVFLKPNHAPAAR